MADIVTTIGSGQDQPTPQAWHDNVITADDGNNYFGKIMVAADVDGGADTNLSKSTTTGQRFVLYADPSVALAAPTKASAAAKARLFGSSVVITGDGYELKGFSIITDADSAIRYGIDSTKSFRAENMWLSGSTINGGSRNIYLHGSGAVATLVNMAFGPTGQDAITCGDGTVQIQQSSILVDAAQRSGILLFSTGACVAKGVKIQGVGTAANFNDLVGSGWGASNYNESADTSAPGANSQLSVTTGFTNTGAGTEDLALTAADAFVNRSGFDSATDVDIVGTSRPSTGADPGCWQTPGGGGTVPTYSYTGSPYSETQGVAISTKTPTKSAGDDATGFTVTTGSLSGTGLALNPTTGAITGTPTGHGTITIGVTPSNGAGNGPETTVEFDVAQSAAPTIAYPATAEAIIGAAFSLTPTTLTGYGDVVTCSPSLPASLSLNSGTGVVTGTPVDADFTAWAGIQNVVFTATDANAEVAHATVAVEIVFKVTVSVDGQDTVVTIHFDSGAVPPDISYADSPIAADIRDDVMTVPTNTGGTITVYSRASGSVPSDWGLELDPFTGVVSGNLTKSGTFSMVVQATGPGGDDTTTLEIDVTNIAPATSWSSPWSPVVGTSPTRPPINTGGDGITNYAEVVGAPNALSEVNAAIDASTGVISFGGGGATPLGADVTVWLRATNAIGVGNTYVLRIRVVAPSSGGIGEPFEIPGVPGRRFIIQEVSPQGPF